MQRWLFFADTPLQMYNAALVASDRAKQGDSSSLLVYDQFANAAYFVDAYERAGVFEQIELVENCPISEYRPQIKWQLGTRLGRYKLRIESLTDEPYDNFALSCPTPATFEVYQRLRAKNRKLAVSYYEDGTGSYNGEIFKTLYSFDKLPVPDEHEPPRIHSMRALVDTLHLKSLAYSPQRLFLKNPRLLSSGITIPVEKIAADSALIDRLAPALLPENIRLEPGKNIIVLDTARYDEPTPESETLDALMEQMVDMNATLALRQHPRSVTASSSAPHFRDLTGGMWEIFCQKEPMLEDALLVSVGSSAQLSPIIEGELKPPLMFLYKLAFTEADALYHAYEHTAQIALESYGAAARRISIPDSIDEALAEIERFTA